MIKHKQDFIQLVGTVVVFGLIVATIAHVAMTPDYWDRGQPPSVATLYESAKEQLAQQVETRAEFRSDITPQVLSLSKALDDANQQFAKGNVPATVAALEAARSSLIAVETSLSIGSRAPYGELTGQLRQLISTVRQGEKIEASTLRLLSSRLTFFFARELQVASPIKPIK